MLRSDASYRHIKKNVYKKMEKLLGCKNKITHETRGGFFVK
jgi:hypothetical protein